MENTIYQENLAPASLLYVGFPNIDPQNPDNVYISKEAFDKYISELHIN